MIETIAILLGVALFIACVGLFGAESRPDFLNPNRKHGPYITPFRLRSR
jgi:hypothetical protein